MHTIKISSKLTAIFDWVQVQTRFVYEENGVIKLLPALFNNLENGSIKGYVLNDNIIDFDGRTAWLQRK